MLNSSEAFLLWSVDVPGSVSGTKTNDDCVIGHSSNCDKRKAFISEQVQYVIKYRLCDGVMCTLCGSRKYPYPPPPPTEGIGNSRGVGGQRPRKFLRGGGGGCI